METAVALL